jgi:hypothetical protein
MPCVLETPQHGAVEKRLHVAVRVREDAPHASVQKDQGVTHQP